MSDSIFNAYGLYKARLVATEGPLSPISYIARRRRSDLSMYSKKPKSIETIRSITPTYQLWLWEVFLICRIKNPSDATWFRDQGRDWFCFMECAKITGGTKIVEEFCLAHDTTVVVGGKAGRVFRNAAVTTKECPDVHPANHSQLTL